MVLAVSDTGHRCQPMRGCQALSLLSNTYVAPSWVTIGNRRGGGPPSRDTWVPLGRRPGRRRAGKRPFPSHISTALPEACTPGHPCPYSIPACAACLAPATGVQLHTPPCCGRLWLAQLAYNPELAKGEHLPPTRPKLRESDPEDTISGGQVEAVDGSLWASRGCNRTPGYTYAKKHHA